MDFSALMKNNPQLMGQAMGALGGGSQQQSGPSTSDAGPGVEPVRKPKDTGDKGYEGIKNVVSTIASFWTGGAGGIAKNAMSTAASGNSGPAPAQTYGASGGGGMGGGDYSQTAQQASGQDWMKKWAGGFSGG